MRSISLCLLLAAPAALAQPIPAPGFAVDRLFLSPAGAGFFVMNDLAQEGAPAAAASLTIGYAHDTLVTGPLAVVRNLTTADLGLSVSWDRFRLSMHFNGPLQSAGQSGEASGYLYAAPIAGLEQNPDLVADPRIALDARLWGDAHAKVRAGASLELIVPSGVWADYTTDGTYRAIGRALIAFESGGLRGAGQVGVQVRPRDDGAVPGGPRGSELLFGVAGGARLGAVEIGPEVFGQTALRSFLGAQTTGLEALLGARLEGRRADGAGYRFRLGVGAGLDPRFGTPAFRLIAGMELYGRAH